MSKESTFRKPDRIEVYKMVGDTSLSIHIFNPAEEAGPDGHPAIVFFYGGGWISGDIGQFIPHAEYLASRGMVAMVAEYRIESRHGTSPRECVMDGKSALRWIRKNAGDLGIDPDRLAAGGGSAGGHVAAAAATIPGLNEAGEDTGIDCVPNALVLFNPVFDNGPDGYGYDRVESYWEEISPAHHIDGSTPPAVVFFGTEDVLISVAVAERFRDRMTEAGVRCDLFLYEGQKHGFFNFDRGATYNLTVIEMDRFLASLGYLEGDPTMVSPSG